MRAGTSLRAVNRLWIWMQVIIVICVIASFVIALDQALTDTDMRGVTLAPRASRPL